MINKMILMSMLLIMFLASDSANAQERRDGDQSPGTVRNLINPNDPCSPWFQGTVFRPCDTTVGTLDWNMTKKTYDVVLDDRLLRMAYTYVLEQEKVKGARRAQTTFVAFVSEIKGLGERLVRSKELPRFPVPTVDGAALTTPPIKLNLEFGGTVKKINWKVSVGVSYP